MTNIKLQSTLALFLLFAFSLLFYFYPAIDIAVSSHFFVAGHFSYLDIAGYVKHTLYFLVGTTITLSLLGIVYGWLKQNASFMRASFFIVLCFIIGPGLIVNSFLKDHWGRPRPRHSIVFNGELSFKPAGIISNECHKNCSYVAGDSSVAFTFLAFAFLPWLRKRRQSIIIGVLILTVINAFFRIASGAHFFSDVVIGILIIYLSIIFCYYLCYGRLNYLRKT